MDGALAIAAQSLLSPMVLFFVLGFAAGLARSDLTVPEAVAKGLALYLMLAIGFKGGVEVARHGLDTHLALTVLSGLALGVILPLIAFTALRATTRLDQANAAAVAAHYGSISVVTFVAAVEFLRTAGVAFEGYMVAVMALMETPAIIVGLWLAGSARKAAPAEAVSHGLWREVFLNGSVVLLVGAFVIGWITGDKGMTAIAPFIDAPFKGVLCLFLLDMGLIASSRLRQAREMSWGLVAFALYMPLIGATLGAGAGVLSGLSTGGVMLLATLSASASYIAVPAAMRLALPQANPAIYLTLSLSLTFPFNITIGLPLYFELATLLTG